MCAVTQRVVGRGRERISPEQAMRVRVLLPLRAGARVATWLALTLLLNWAPSGHAAESDLPLDRRPSTFLSTCRQPRFADFYPEQMGRQRYEARMLVRLEVSPNGRPARFSVLASEGKPEFLQSAERLFMALRCKPLAEPLNIVLSVTYVLEDGPGVEHYFPSADQVTITWGKVRR